VEKQVEFKVLREVKKVCSRVKTRTSGEWTSAWSGNEQTEIPGEPRKKKFPLELIFK